MKEELELDLVKKYPELCCDYRGDYTKTCFSFGFECGDGWYEIINNALSEIDKLCKINDLKIKIAQIKSKFGRLVIYIDILPEQKTKQEKTQQLLQQIYGIIDSAEKQSMSISEISGLPAKQHVINGWVYTITDKEALTISNNI